MSTAGPSPARVATQSAKSTTTWLLSSSLLAVPGGPKWLQDLWNTYIHTCPSLSQAEIHVNLEQNLHEYPANLHEVFLLSEACGWDLGRGSAGQPPEKCLSFVFWYSKFCVFLRKLKVVKVPNLKFIKMGKEIDFLRDQNWRLNEVLGDIRSKIFPNIH